MRAAAGYLGVFYGTMPPAKTIPWSEARRRILAAAGRASNAWLFDEAIQEAEAAARWYRTKSGRGGRGR